MPPTSVMTSSPLPRKPTELATRISRFVLTPSAIEFASLGPRVFTVVRGIAQFPLQHIHPPSLRLPSILLFIPFFTPDLTVRVEEMSRGGYNVDYSLYLVTDSTPAILGDRDLVNVVEASLRGGVTVVQYRDKTSSTEHLISTARQIHQVIQQYRIPLLINDRLDVALAVGCEGVHIGQDDLDLLTARRLLGDDAIIGMTVSTIDEAQKACAEGANYLGIGTMFSTPTKVDTKTTIGTAGTRKVLEAISDSGKDVRTVCIGGINATNIQRVLFQSSAPSKSLDGVAVVSAIVAAKDPEKAAGDLLKLVKNPPCFATTQLLQSVPAIIKKVGATVPLSHNMTNLVVQNFAASVALAVGGSPIMTNYGEEAQDISELGGSLVINMGTVTPDGLQNYAQALQAYNLAGGPVLLDPVGGGATIVRRSAIKTLLSMGYFDVIKGNEGEIKAVFGSMEQQKGVDSGPSTLSDIEKATLVRDVAARERNVVVMTGARDFLSDGTRTFVISNGHGLLGKITGSGCVLGTTISLMLTASRDDKLLAAIAGLLHYEIAAEIAATRKDVQGPGTFVAALIDELYNVQKATTQGNLQWMSGAKVAAIEL
ncbi:Hydroxyethylthiazole kinase family-domain-containing protein [Calycina marina]|uniref:Hydroxyethylthiazole kinase family-domain-containing protein n=1 Tax=Calycina marina TaxID=1763456 RepID=A0A9P8CFY9_9HELO|nr:Hydroxyethylthiazole kinase family-domain-containing protein [Calycina marina]